MEKINTANFYILIISVLVSGIFFLNFKNYNKPIINLEISTSIDINDIELYINNLQDNPKKISNINKDSRQYHHELDGNLDFLRIDFGDARENVIKIYSLKFQFNDQFIVI